MQGYSTKKPVLGGTPAWSVAAPARLYAFYAVCLATLLVYLSEYIGFRDQGDFARAVGGMVRFPEGGIGRASQMRWDFHPGGFYPVDGFNLAAYVFRALGAGVWELSTSFHLGMVSLPAKVLVAAAIHMLASFYARQFQARYRVQAAAFGILAVAVFQAHNIGMLKSFYSEVLVFVFFTVLLAALAGWPRRGAGWWIVAASIGMGLTKPQYFNVPLLALACLLAIRNGRGRGQGVPWRFVVAMLVGQALCVLPVLHNPYAQLNYHQSTYFGSYLVQSPAQLQALGLTPHQQACVGIDAWGDRADGPGGSRPYRKGVSCYRESPQSLRDVLAPYAADPLTLWRLSVYALPAHFTVGYFHVFRDLFYVAPAGADYGPGAVLMKLTAWREATVTPMAVPLVLIGLALPWWLRRTDRALLAPTLLFLSVFVVTQAVVSLVGEGIRDLSKHLWAAQLALDLLVVALLGQVGLRVAAYRSKPRRAFERDDSKLP